MLTAVLSVALFAQAPAPTSLFDELTTTGLNIPGHEKRFKLPTPVMARGLNKAQMQAVLDRFADEKPAGLFIERTDGAPHICKVLPILDKAGKRHGLTMDVYFVAYGKVDQLDKLNATNTLLGMKHKGAEPRFLDDKELQARKIKPTLIKGIEERFVLMDLSLDDRIQLAGVVQNQKRTMDGSLVSAMTIDDRFADDKKHPNCWRRIKDDGGLGPPGRYSGFGGYSKVTPMPGKGDMLFVEMHFAFAEPYEWFSGKNLLASKLPLAVNNNVLVFRRKLRSLGTTETKTRP